MSEEKSISSAQDINKSRPYRTEQFDKVFFKVFSEQPFLSTISLEVTKVADEGVPTAYMASIKDEDGQYVFTSGFNPKFMDGLTQEEQVGVVCHEMYHLVFMHVTKRNVLDKRYAQLWNFATDLAINSLITNSGKDTKVLPSFCLLPGRRPKMGENSNKLSEAIADFMEKAPHLESSDWYFDKLKKIVEDPNNNDDKSNGNGDGVSGIETLDDHSGWGDIPVEVQDQMNEKIRGMLEKAAKEADRTNKWGNIPMEIRESIRELYSREIDWRQILRNFWGRTRSEERLSSLKKINKRAMYKFPGVKRKTRAEFVCFIDQSGSMADEDISLLFGELEGLAKETGIDVFVFDTEIDKKSHQKWKRKQPKPKLMRTRCGGTDFNAIADFLNSRENRGRWSGAIILTDGYAPKLGQVFDCKVLWVITEHGTLDAVRSGDLACKMKSPKKGFESHK